MFSNLRINPGFPKSTLFSTECSLQLMAAPLVTILGKSYEDAHELKSMRKEGFPDDIELVHDTEICSNRL